ncbi:CoA-disulfide reductase [Clostridium celatum]|uniref:CoA-disulfide reductase n=1 Tax=Clostridium celatum TaxID=36834 RepID=UPI00189AE947|nr:CoA-disulfide reductase [Clostridium celatum]MDU2265927.1 CoA-disulfide reductase [Clostridium celatum]MDU6296235.1 CoA-disulfide reductase [Clostridium celatum]MDY3362269.1 CoA-disulfide reductase [Clostridium celatum]
MKVVIIGGVAAGMSAAAKFKRLSPNDEVIVYEKGDIVSFGACGLPYYVGGFFDDSREMIARTPEEFKASGVEIHIKHEVLSVDFKAKKLHIKNLISNEILEENYDKLMIASGARAIIPPIKNVNLENVVTLKSLDDGNKLKDLMANEEYKKVTIIGAGFIGLEAVEAAMHRGKEVTVIQLQDRVLQEVFDKDITDLLEDELRDSGVNLLLNETVVELIGDEKVYKVKTNKRELETDIVILATGVKPNTDFLNSDEIEMIRNGAIVVDQYGRTSVEDVYSAGDCATINNLITGKPVYVPLATGANKLGRIVGENLAGQNNSFQGSMASSCIKVMNMEAARTGLSEKEVKDLGFDYKTKFITDMNQTSYYPGRERIYVKLIYDAHTKVILGGQVAGYKDAVQRCNVLAACIYAKMTTDQLGMLDLCYSPPFARTWDVLNVAGNVSK